MDLEQFFRWPVLVALCAGIAVLMLLAWRANKKRRLLDETIVAAIKDHGRSIQFSTLRQSVSGRMRRKVTERQLDAAVKRLEVAKVAYNHTRLGNRRIGLYKQ